MKLLHKLTLIFLAIGIIPALTIGSVSLYKASSSLSDQSFNQLRTIRAIKQSQVETYLSERKSDMAVLTEMISSLYEEFHDFNKVKAVLSQPRRGMVEGFFGQYIKAYDYYDLFLIDAQGNVVYTVEEEADLGTNLLAGPYKDSGLGKIFRRVRDSRKYALQDFSPYAPSNNEPAGFVAQPVYFNNELVMVLALQLSIQKINTIMQLRDGMGETGESYLVGPDKRMRSDSYLDPRGHTVSASFAGSVEENGVDTQASRDALAGVRDVNIVIDYNGNSVLSAYAPVNVEGETWALIAEIDEAEAFSAVESLVQTMFLIFVVAIGLIVFFAIRVARTIMRPLGGEPHEMSHMAKQIADGNLLLNFKDTAHSESVYTSMKHMTTQLRLLVGNVITYSGELARSSEETAVVTQQTHVNVQKQQHETVQISSAINEMAASSQEVANNTLAAANAANTATQAANSAKQITETTIDAVTKLSLEVTQSKNVVQSLSEHSENIGSVLGVIVGIADQTNLLALNAAIEAARAGEQGRGFAVVAEEVRALAQKTQESTKDIEQMIDKLQTGANKAVDVMVGSVETARLTISTAKEAGKAIESINNIVHGINDMNAQISSATEQQTVAIEEINRSLLSISETGIETTGGAKQTSEATVEVARLAEQLQGMVLDFKV